MTKKNALYPFELSFITRSPVWSGTRLADEWGKSDGNLKRIGESWELSVRKNEMSMVINGVFAGKELGTLIDMYGKDITGNGFGSENFPLLVKLIDSGEALSVQVHPDDEYAISVEGTSGKTEMWYIIDAEEGAHVILGTKKGVGKEMIAGVTDPEKAESIFNKVTVHAGETYFIPAGLLHAIGKGILLAEVQQNSDLTYRIYDYGRVESGTKTRELHTEKALDVIRDFTAQEIEKLRFSRSFKMQKGGVLADSDCFYVELADTTREKRTIPTSGKMLHMLCIEGAGDIGYDGKSYEVRKGSSYLIPACLESIFLGGVKMLITHDSSYLS